MWFCAVTVTRAHCKIGDYMNSGSNLTEVFFLFSWFHLSFPMNFPRNIVRLLECNILYMNRHVGEFTYLN